MKNDPVRMTPLNFCISESAWKKDQTPIPPCAVRARLTGGINEIAVHQYRYFDKHRVAFYLGYVGRERKRKTLFLTLGT